MKKIATLFIAIFLVISTIPLRNALAAETVTNPTVVSLSIDKNEVTAGDTINVRLKLSDSTGINYINLYYPSPISGKNMTVSLNYNRDLDVFEGSIPVDNSFESGQYLPNMISFYDSTGSISTIYQSDFQNQVQNGTFTVSGTTGSNNIVSIQIDKKDVAPGDTVKVSVKTADHTDINEINLFYITPISNSGLYVSLYFNSETNAYEGNIPINSTTESGTFSLNMLSIYGSGGNVTSMYRSQNDQLFQTGDFVVSGTSGEDVIDSVNLVKQAVTAGDLVKVSVKARDNTGISYMNVYYTSPISQKSFSVDLSYNSETDSYEGSFPIQKDSEVGTYNLYMLGIYDTSGNTMALYRSYYESKFKNGDYTVFTESNPPSFKSLSIDKTTVEPGDNLNITVDGTDDTHLQSAVMTYTTPVSQSKKTISLSYDGQHFVGQLPIDSNTEVGKWKVDSVEITDTNGNSTLVIADGTDLTAGTFTVLPPVSPINSYMVNTNETWSNKTVNSDVYIAPGAVLTVNGNVVINGNVYVLGGLQSNGGLTLNGSLYANSISFDSYSPSSGQAVLSGSNSITNMVASNRVLNDVPFTLYDTPIIRTGGKVNISGATLPFVTMEINGQPVSLKSDGTFRLSDFYIGNSDTLNVKITDLDGYNYSYSYTISEMMVDELTKNSQSFTGKTSPNCTVKVFNNGNQVGLGASDDKGSFSIPASHLVENSQVTFDVYNAENVLVTSRDVTVKDVTAPEKPIINEVSDKDTSVSGQAEAGAKIEVKVNGSVIGSESAGKDGMFSISIPTQSAGTELVVIAIDSAGNVSEEAKVSVIKAKPFGWVQDKGNWYYFDPTTGNDKTGWFKFGSSWYFFNENGSMQTGWVKIGTSWYCLKDNGSMQTGWAKIGTSWYYFKNNGSMQTSWAKIGTSWYYFTINGTMQAGWLKIGTSWYYLNNSGVMVTGKTKISGKWYVFNNNGALK